MPALPPRLGSTPSSAVALVGAGDPESSRLVYAMVIGLAVVGVVLIGLGIWLIRQTRADLEVLAPLERMGDGDWKKRDRSTQRRMLDEVRPEGAVPLTPATQPPSLDDEFEQTDHPVTSFSDLGPGVASEQRDPTPAGRIDDLLFDDVVAEHDAEAVVDEAVEDEAVEVDQGEVDQVIDEVVVDADEGEDNDTLAVVDGAEDDPRLDLDDEAMSDPRG